MNTTQDMNPPTPDRRLGIITAILSAVGLFGAGMLVWEKISYWQQKAEGTSPALSCDINPLISCGSVLNSEPASIFGDLPNPLIGVVGFSALIALMVVVGSGTRLPEWMWAGLQAGVVFGLAIVTYLQYQSIYVLAALCPYCMVVWAMMIPIFWLVTARNLRTWFRDRVWGSFVSEWIVLTVFFHFVLLLTLIWFRFGDSLWA